MSTEKVYLLIGSNLGNSENFLKEAEKKLSSLKNVVLKRVSKIYKTEPWGVKNQNWFLNRILEIETSLEPQELLEQCQKTETILGRNRTKETRWGERTMDIDIIFYGNKIIRTQNLTIPHLYMHKRAFVLVPMMDLEENFIHPVFKKSVKELFEELEEKEAVIPLSNTKEEAVL